MDTSLRYSDDALREGLHTARNQNGLFLLLSKLLKRIIRIKPWWAVSTDGSCVLPSLPLSSTSCFSWHDGEDPCKLWKTLSADMFPNIRTAASCFTSTVVWLEWSPTYSYTHHQSIMLVHRAAGSLDKERNAACPKLQVYTKRLQPYNFLKMEIFVWDATCRNAHACSKFVQSLGFLWAFKVAMG